MSTECRVDLTCNDLQIPTNCVLRNIKQAGKRKELTRHFFYSIVTMEDLDEEEAAMLKAFRAKKKAAKEKKLAAERAVGVEGRSVDNSGRSADAPQSGSGKGEDTTMTPQDLRTQLEQVVEGIKLLLTQGELDKATSAAATLHSVASKLLLAEKDPKYRSINLNNTKLQAKLFWGDELSHGARKLLEALGFAMTDKNTRMTLAAADEKPELLRYCLV